MVYYTISPDLRTRMNYYTISMKNNSAFANLRAWWNMEAKE